MYKTVLVALDLDDPSDLEVTLARAIAMVRASPGATLHAMTVLPPFGMSIVGQFFPKGYEHAVGQALMARLREEVDRRLPDGLTAQHIVGEGKVYETVLRIAEREGADLIVIGAHRPELADYLLGPNAARVVRHAKASVLVVRG
jgi:nucleotide-binding universal stress UspA family protein